MKVLVFSDSHGKRQPMADLIALHRPDGVFHLGDVVRDMEKVQELCPGLTVYQVPGNCDHLLTYVPTWEQEGVARLAGKTIFYLHGHTRQVKSGPRYAIDQARAIGADVLLYGHTHKPVCYDQDGLLVVNPGAMQNGCYALLTWEDGEPIKAELKQID